MNSARWCDGLRWLGAVTIAVIAVMRTTVFFASQPVFDLDPAYYPILGGLSAAGSLWLDIVLLLGCAAALVGEARSGRGIDGRLLLLAVVPVPVILWHGATDAEDLWRGVTWAAAALAGATIAHLARERAMRTILIGLLAAALVPLLVRGAANVTFEYERTVEDFERNKASILAEKGWEPGSSNALLFERRLRNREPSGWSITTNVYGSAMAFGLAVWIGLAAASARAKLQSGWTGLLAILAVATAAGLWMTGSKGAILAGAGGLGLLAAGWTTGRLGHLVVRWAPALCAASVFVALGVVALRGAALPESFAGEKSLLFRWHYLTAATRIIGDDPLRGVGPGGFQAAYLAHRPARSPEEVGTAHSTFVDWLSALGVSAVAWIVLVVVLLARAGAVLGARPPPAADDPPAQRVTVIAAMAVGALGLLPSMILESNEPDPLAMFLRLLGCGGFVLVAILTVGAVQGSDRRLVDWAVTAGVVALFVHGQIEMTMTRPGSAVWTLAVLGLAGGARPGRRGWPGVAASAAAVAGAVWLAVTGAMPAYRQELVMVDAARTLWPIAEGRRALRVLAEVADYAEAAPAAARLDAALGTLGVREGNEERQALERYVATARPVSPEKLRRIDRLLRAAEPGERRRAADRLMDAAQEMPERKGVSVAAADQLLEAASLLDDEETREVVLRHALAVLDAPLAGRAASLAITAHVELARLTGDPAHEDAAIDLAEAMVQADPNGLRAWKRLGDLAWAFGRRTRAREAYVRTLEIDGNFALDPLKQLNDDERAVVRERGGNP